MKKKKRIAQITILFMVILSVAMLFVMVMTDLGRVVINKFMMDVSVDNAALMLGSTIASENNVGNQTVLDGNLFTNVTTLSDTGSAMMVIGIIIIVIIIVVYILVTVLTEGLASWAVKEVGFAIAAIAIAFGIGATLAMGMWMVSEYSRQQGIVAQWASDISSLPTKDARYREQTISSLIPALAMDAEKVMDIHDMDRDTWNKDEIGRFMFWYSDRLRKLVNNTEASGAWLMYNTTVVPKMLKITKNLSLLAEPTSIDPLNIVSSADLNSETNLENYRGALRLSLVEEIFNDGIVELYQEEDYFNTLHGASENFKTKLEYIANGKTRTIDGTSYPYYSRGLWNLIDDVFYKSELRYVRYANAAGTSYTRESVATILTEFDRLVEEAQDEAERMRDEARAALVQPVYDQCLRDNCSFMYGAQLSQCRADCTEEVNTSLDTEINAITARQFDKYPNVNDAELKALKEHFVAMENKAYSQEIDPTATVESLPRLNGDGANTADKILPENSGLSHYGFDAYQRFYYKLDGQNVSSEINAENNFWNAAHDRRARQEYVACRGTQTGNVSYKVYDDDPDTSSTYKTVTANCSSLDPNWRNPDGQIYEEQRTRVGKQISMGSQTTEDGTTTVPLFVQQRSLMSETIWQVKDLKEKLASWLDFDYELTEANFAEITDVPDNELDNGPLLQSNDTDDWQAFKLTNSSIAGAHQDGWAASGNASKILERVPKSTPRRTYKTVANLNGDFQFFMDVAGDKKHPNLYKIEGLLNSFLMNYQLWEHFIPTNYVKQGISTEGKPLFLNEYITKTHPADSPQNVGFDTVYYGESFDYDFYADVASPTVHNRHNRQIIRKLWVLKNILETHTWDVLRYLETKQTYTYDRIYSILEPLLRDFNAQLETENVNAMNALIYRLVKFPKENINEIKRKIARLCPDHVLPYAPVAETDPRHPGYSGASSTKMAMNSDYFNPYGVSNIVSIAAFATGTYSLDDVRKSLTDSLIDMSNAVRGTSATQHSDIGEMFYVWRDSLENGGKWHIAYVHVDPNIPYPSYGTMDDTKWSDTYGIVWMKPYVEPEWDWVSSAENNIKGVKNWKKHNQSLWVSAARFDEPNKLLGIPLYSSIKKETGTYNGYRHWDKLKNKLKFEYLIPQAELIAAKAGWMFANAEDKKKFIKSMSQGQVILRAQGETLFDELKRFMVTNGIWSRAQIEINIDSIVCDGSYDNNDAWKICDSGRQDINIKSVSNSAPGDWTGASASDY